MKKCYPTILDDASDMSVHDTDHVEKFVLSPKIRALNDHTKLHDPVLLYNEWYVQHA